MLFGGTRHRSATPRVQNLWPVGRLGILMAAIPARAGAADPKTGGLPVWVVSEAIENLNPSAGCILRANIKVERETIDRVGR